MPLTSKGKKLKRKFRAEYKGKERGDAVFYGALNKGTIQGVEKDETKKRKPTGRR